MTNKKCRRLVQPPEFIFSLLRFIVFVFDLSDSPFTVHCSLFTVHAFDLTIYDLRIFK